MASLLVRPAFLVARALILFVPATSAEVDPRIHEDAAPCLKAVEDQRNGSSNGASCVVAYAHLPPHGGLRGVLNVQRPPDEVAPVESGSFQPPLSAFWDLPTWRFDLQQGMVDYTGDDMTFTNPGMFDAEVALHPDVPVHVRLHFTADHPSPLKVADALPPAGVSPCVTIQAELRTATTFDSPGSVLTSAQTVGHLARPDLPLPDLACADTGTFHTDSDGITTFDLVLPPPPRGLERGEGAWLHVVAYHLEPNGARTTLPGVRLVHDADHLDHVVFALDDALVFEDVQPLWADGTTYLRVNVSSPWGDYDIDRETLDLQVLDAEGNVVAARSTGEVPDPALRHRISHDSQDTPLQAAFPLDQVLADLADGTYTFRVVADNGQHTAHATVDTKILLSDDGRTFSFQDVDGTTTVYALHDTAVTPAPGLLPLLTLLGLAAAASRRPRS